MKFFKPVLVVTLLIALATIALSITPKKGKTGNRSNGKALSEEDKWVNAKLTKMTLEEKIGQSFMVACLSKTPKKGKTGNRSNGKALSEEDKWVNDKLTKMTLEEKIGQSFMVACWSNRGDSHIEEIEQQITEDKIGGVIFFQGERGNLQNSIDRFQKKAETPLLIGMDAEWGIAMRIFQ